jgi:hypothetical protein
MQLQLIQHYQLPWKQKKVEPDVEDDDEPPPMLLAPDSEQQDEIPAVPTTESDAEQEGTAERENKRAKLLDFVSLTINMTVREVRQFLQSPEIFVTTRLRNSEVSFSRLTAADKKLFEAAKKQEVSQFIATEAVRACIDKAEEQEGWDSGRIMKARWVLTWKIIPPEERQAALEKDKSNPIPTVKPDGSKKAKARIVILGFQHPDLEDPKFKTTSPVVSQHTRALILQLIVFHNWIIESCDATTAFLQAEGKEEQYRLWTTGVAELCQALGVTPGTLLRILRACYGLTTAPRSFWQDVDKKMTSSELKGHKILGDACTWIFVDPDGKLLGVACCHVDDFLLAGNLSDQRWLQTKQLIKDMYKWGAWKSGLLRFAGIDIQQDAEYEITIDQEHYAEQLSDIDVDAGRLRLIKEKMTNHEISACRAALGALQWLGVQTCLMLCARVGLLLSRCMAEATLHVACDIQNLIKEARNSFTRIKFVTIPSAQGDWKNVVFLTYGDASHLNREKGGSTGGMLTLAGGPEILEGKNARMSIIHWRSWKLKRVAVGTTCAEVQAMSEAEDVNYKLRLIWAELNGAGLAYGKRTEARAEACIQQVKGLVASDSKGGYDAVERNETANLGLQSTRTAVQAYQIKQNFMTNNASLRWVAADWNLADGFTKDSSESRQSLEAYLKTQIWRIEYHPEFIVSARKAKRLGRDAITMMEQPSREVAEPDPEDKDEELLPMPFDSHLACHI